MRGQLHNHASSLFAGPLEDTQQPALQHSLCHLTLLYLMRFVLAGDWQVLCWQDCAGGDTWRGTAALF